MVDRTTHGDENVGYVMAAELSRRQFFLLNPREFIAPIGKVKMNLKTCLNGHGGICDICAVACPSHINAIKMKGMRAVLDEELCVGCRICIDRCPTTPPSLIFETSDE
jgi:ferredoxin